VAETAASERVERVSGSSTRTRPGVTSALDEAGEPSGILAASHNHQAIS
jgi:hypothetical protein